MKKRIPIALSFFFIGNSALAQSLSLETNRTTADIDDPLSLTINIQGEFQGNGEIEIPNLKEHFDIVSQSRASNTQIINGKVSQQNQIQLQLRAKEAGKYKIGPARVQNKTGYILSNPIDLNITGERMFLNGKPPANNSLNSKEKSDTIHRESGTTLTGDEKTKATLPMRRRIIILLAAAGRLRSTSSKKSTISEKETGKAKRKERGEITMKEKVHDHHRNELPDIDDENYIQKIDEYLKHYLEHEGLGERVRSMSHQEIKEQRKQKRNETVGKQSEKQKEDQEEKENTIHEILKLLQTAKYGTGRTMKKQLHEKCSQLESP